MINYESPTEKQIAFADTIAYDLDLDFPTCSQDYTKAAYRAFISEYYNEWMQAISEDPAYFDDDEMAWWDPFAEGGY